jgi:hypothetical protein
MSPVYSRLQRERLVNRSLSALMIERRLVSQANPHQCTC